MNTVPNISLTDQIQMLTEQDLIRLRAFIDDLIRRNSQRTQPKLKDTASSVPLLAHLKPVGIPGGKSPFNRAMIYDDLAI